MGMSRKKIIVVAAVAVVIIIVAVLSLGTKDSKDSGLVTQRAPRGDVIVNLFQWNWASVASECTSDIGPAGYGYVQVSPPMEHKTGTQWWTSYQPVSYQIESKFGSREEFAKMVETCKTAGVEVIADVVINHMAEGAGVGVAGSTFAEDDFPGIYDAEDFNDCRTNIATYLLRDEVQNCRLGGLQDLRTSSLRVQATLAAYFNDLIDLGVSGFRVDAVKHIPAEDLVAIKAQLSDPDILWVQEMMGAYGEPIRPEEYVATGLVMEFDYARKLKEYFTNKIKNLANIEKAKLPSQDAAVFIDNHDTERNGSTLNYKDDEAYLLANIFMLSWPYGKPTVYSGYSWNDRDTGAPGATETSVPDTDCAGEEWTCFHRSDQILAMIEFHNMTGQTPVSDWWDNGDNVVAYGREDKGFVVLNNSADSVHQTFQTSLKAGTYCNVLVRAPAGKCGETVTVNDKGEFSAEIANHSALVLSRSTR